MTPDDPDPRFGSWGVVRLRRAAKRQVENRNFAKPPLLTVRHPHCHGHGTGGGASAGRGVRARAATGSGTAECRSRAADSESETYTGKISTATSGDPPMERSGWRLLMFGGAWTKVARVSFPRAVSICGSASNRAANTLPIQPSGRGCYSGKPPRARNHCPCHRYTDQ